MIIVNTTIFLVHKLIFIILITYTHTHTHKTYNFITYNWSAICPQISSCRYDFFLWMRDTYLAWYHIKGYILKVRCNSRTLSRYCHDCKASCTQD